jgi:nucleoside-diphosphate-sugar epimerase
VLGRRLVRQFAERGHAVVGLVRSTNGENIVRALGGEPRQADLFHADSLAKAADGCDTVIHAATAIPTKRRATPGDWAMNDRIRRQGTRRLTEAAGKIGAKAYLQQSVVWVARPKDGAAFDEDSPTVPDPSVQSAIDAETIAREAGSVDGFTTAVLRGGAYYDSDSAHTQMLAAEQPRNGVWHVVDNDPVTVRDLLLAWASRLGARPPRRVPVWLAKWLAGEDIVRYFTSSTRTTNARLRRDFGWTPRYPSYREGLDQIVAAWNAEAPHMALASAAKTEKKMANSSRSG